MNFNCPNCELNLKNKYMLTKGVGELVVKLPPPINKEFHQQFPICPKCNIPLEMNIHSFDVKFARLIPSLLAILFFGFFVNSIIIQVLAGVVFFGVILWAVKVIISPEYKNWRYWRIYNKQL